MKTSAVTIVAAWISAETGSWSLHRVGQPGVQQKLRRLAHRAHKQEQTHGRERIDIPTEEMKALADERRRLREDGVKIDRAGEKKTAKMPSEKPKSPTRLTMKALIAAASASGS